jgi:hypothetical protein
MKSNAPTTFAAKYPNSICKSCKQEIEVGAMIKRLETGYGYVHDTCPAAARPTPKAPIVAAESVAVQPKVWGVEPPAGAPIFDDPFVGGPSLVINLKEIEVEDVPASALAQQPTEQPTPKWPKFLGEGRYTIEWPDGDYRTIKVQMPNPLRDFAPDKIILSYLNGPDNTSNYKGFAFIGDDGELHVWKSFAADSKLVEAARILMQDPLKAGEAWALKSGQCFRCGLDLTVPASLHRGLGPICWEKAGKP